MLPLVPVPVHAGVALASEPAIAPDADTEFPADVARTLVAVEEAEGRAVGDAVARAAEEGFFVVIVVVAAAVVGDDDYARHAPSLGRAPRDLGRIGRNHPVRLVPGRGWVMGRGFQGLQFRDG